MIILCPHCQAQNSIVHSSLATCLLLRQVSMTDNGELNLALIGESSPTKTGDSGTFGCSECNSEVFFDDTAKTFGVSKTL